MDKNTLFFSFGKWLLPICTKTFIERVAAVDQDKYVKKLTTLSYFKLFLHAQLHQKELGITSISASQLCRKNNQVDPALL